MVTYHTTFCQFDLLSDLLIITTDHIYMYNTVDCMSLGVRGNQRGEDAKLHTDSDPSLGSN